MSITDSPSWQSLALTEWEWDGILSEPPSLLGEDPTTLTLAGKIEFLSEVQRQRAWLASLEARALVAVAGAEPSHRTITVPDQPPADDGDAVDASPTKTLTIVDEVVDLVAVALRRSATTVRRQVDEARMIHGTLRQTSFFLRDGTITPEHASAIARIGDGLEGYALQQFERQVLAKALHSTSAETAVFARRVRARVDAAGEEQRRQRARKHVDVRVWGEDDGLACLMARLPLADAARVHAALELGAREVDLDCGATIGERRVAALVAAVCADSSSGTLPPEVLADARVGAEIQVTVDLATLMGLADSAALVALGSGAAEPITASAVRDLISDPAIPIALRRLVTDPMTGRVLDRGRTSYRVPESLRAFLVARDGVCRFPGCLRAATQCQMDHAVPWDGGGRSDRDNLGPLCVRHHLLKTHSGWSLTGTRPDGTTEWEGPDGRAYVSHPLDVLQPPTSGPPDDYGPRAARSPSATAPRRAFDVDPPPF